MRKKMFRRSRMRCEICGLPLINCDCRINGPQEEVFIVEPPEEALRSEFVPRPPQAIMKGQVIA